MFCKHLLLLHVIFWVVHVQFMLLPCLLPDLLHESIFYHLIIVICCLFNNSRSYFCCLVNYVPSSVGEVVPIQPPSLLSFSFSSSSSTFSIVPFPFFFAFVVSCLKLKYSGSITAKPRTLFLLIFVCSL